MNYNVLRYFSVLAQVEHYTVAAARLGISQPSLSSAIHNLETELGGVKLFEKVGRNIRLTDEGRFYQEKVDAALNELHAASLILRDSKSSAPIVIRMGFVSGTLNGLVAEKIAEYSHKNKRIRFHLTESSAENLMDLVRQEKLDMAIVDSTDRDRSLHFRKLKERAFFVALPDGHPLAEQAHLEPHEVVHESQVVFNYDVGKSFKEWTTGTPADESVICTVDTAQAALDLVEAGVGIAFIPDRCVKPQKGIRYVPLKNWHQALYMCILYDKWLEPPVWDFVENIVRSIRTSDAQKLQDQQ
ncbi:MAG: LysR family transcriptional regulator [Ruminococcaceae bacterium]|nr:LysR family transcriptional regulator [Oscillospiraceae bacterium]